MFVQQPFLSMKLKSISEYPFISFSPTFEEFINIIQLIFKKIIIIGENIPRAETYLFPGKLASTFDILILN